MKTKFLQGIGINVILLGIVSFITDVSSEMMLAILPMFILSLGGTGIAVGLIGGIGDSISSLLKVFSGYASDKIARRKPFVFWGYFTSSVAKLFFPFSSHWSHLLILRPIERIGKGLRTAPRDAIISSSSSEATRGKAFGIHRAADTSGAFIGALLAYIFYWFLRFDFKLILIIAGIISFFALIPIFWVKEELVCKIQKEKLTFRASIKNLPSNFRRYLLAATIFALGNFTYMFFVLKARSAFSQFYSPRIATAIPILLYVWFNIIYALFSVPSGAFSDKVGRKKVIVLGYFIYALTCLGFAWLGTSAVTFLLLFGIYGISFALIEPNQRAFASDFVPEELRGTVLGTFHTSVSLATLPASIIAGLLWNYNSSAPFIYGGVIALLAVVLLSLSHPVSSK